MLLQREQAICLIQPVRGYVGNHSVFVFELTLSGGRPAGAVSADSLCDLALLASS